MQYFFYIQSNFFSDEDDDCISIFNFLQINLYKNFFRLEFGFFSSELVIFKSLRQFQLVFLKNASYKGFIAFESPCKLVADGSHGIKLEAAKLK